MIKDKEFIEANSPEHFDTLSPNRKAVLLVWLMTNVETHRTIGYRSRRTSYGLKHDFERSKAGFYITNGQFKGAMIASGFKPRDEKQLNWEYTVGKNVGKPMGWRRDKARRA